MKQWKIVLFSFMFLFITSVVYAHEEEGEEAENYLKDFSTDEHDHSEAISNQESHNHTDTTSTDSHGHSNTHDDGGGEHSTLDGEEIGPNMVVLSSVAMINAAFLLVGIWNKWRRRGVNDGTI